MDGLRVYVQARDEVFLVSPDNQHNRSTKEDIEATNYPFWQSFSLAHRRAFRVLASNAGKPGAAADARIIRALHGGSLPFPGPDRRALNRGATRPDLPSYL